MENISEDSFLINLREKVELIEEWGSTQTIRFIQKSEQTKETPCIDCDAKSLAFALEGMNSDDPLLRKMKQAILFILWNTNWPVGD